MKDRSTTAANTVAGPKESQGTDNLETSTNSAEVASRTAHSSSHSSDPNAIAKIDRNKNLINNENQPPLENNLTNNSANIGSSANSSSSQQQPKSQPPQTELKIVSIEGSTIADDDKDSIVNSCNTISSNCLPVKGSSADETDKATESNLDSDLNIKNNNNIIQSKTNSTTSTTITNSAGGTAEIDPVPTTYEDTKESISSTVQSSQSAVAKNGSTDSMNTINNNKNVAVDKDLDNNDVTITEAAPLPPNDTVSDDQLANKVAGGENAALGPQSLAAKNAAAAKTLNYGEGQWSPENVEGRKYYVREQLLTLQFTAASLSAPQIQDQFQLLVRKSNNNFMPSFASSNKNQSSSGGSNRNPMFKRPSTQGQQMQQGGKGSKQGMIHVSLSLREDVKLNESANAWKPSFMNNTVVDDNDDVEILCRKVRGILNKLTPEKFEPLLEQIQLLNISSSEKLASVINLVFEKAIDEPNFASAYAMLCKNLTKPIEDKEAREKTSATQQSPFKKELVNKCQKEFDNHVADETAIQTKLSPIINEINNTNDSNRKLELRAQLQDEESKLRRRSVGTVRFIGELYRQGMLTTNIMEWCITTLLDSRSEEKLECLCKLLTTVGHKMEEKTNDPSTDKKNYRDLSLHFQSMQNLADNKKGNKISSRVRFMLLDVIELRRNKWVSKRNDYNPKTMGQIQREAEQEQYNKQLLNYNVGGGGMGGGSSSMTGNNNRKDNRNDRNDRNDRGNIRNDSRSGSGGNYNNANSNNNKAGRGGGYQDLDGWTPANNKGRGGNSNTSIDPSKFKGKAVSITYN